MKNLLIIGTGGFARVTYGTALESIGYQREWILKGFLAGDFPPKEGEYEHLSLPVLGNINDYSIERDDVFICAVGDVHAREKLVGFVKEKGGEFTNVIHKNVSVQPNVKTGIGNILCFGAYLNEHSTIGNFVILNMCAGLGHDSSVGDYCSLMPRSGVGGFASVGKYAFLGTSAQVLPYATVGNDVRIGVGSVVYKQAEKAGTYFGNPAKRIL